MTLATSNLGLTSNPVIKTASEFCSKRDSEQRLLGSSAQAKLRFMTLIPKGFHDYLAQNKTLLMILWKTF